MFLGKTWSYLSASHLLLSLVLFLCVCHHSVGNTRTQPLISVCPWGDTSNFQTTQTYSDKVRTELLFWDLVFKVTTA